MRRLHPGALRRQVSPPLNRVFRPVPGSSLVRPLSSTAFTAYPRSGPRQSFKITIPATPDVEIDAPEEEDPEDLAASPIPPRDPNHPPFESYAISFKAPQPTAGPIPEDLRPLLYHLTTTFLPANQSLESHRSSGKGKATSSPSSPIQFVHNLQLLSGSAEGSHEAGPSESVLALVSPFEGGGGYLSEALERVAAHADADIVEISLPLSIGLDGPSAPLSPLGVSAPSLPTNVNPVMTGAFVPVQEESIVAEQQDEEDEDDPEMQGSPGIRIVTTVPMMDISATPQNQAPGGVQDDWVRFFDKLVNFSPAPSDPTRKRIIFLTHPEAMASSFDTWWPSLVEAVRRRRRRAKSTFDHPTTIVFGSSPSILTPHTASFSGSASEEASASPHPVLQELAVRFGGHVERRDVDSDTPLWWGSPEDDIEGRQARNRKRLSIVHESEKGAAALLPSFGETPRQRPSHPFLAMLAGQQSGQPTRATAEPIVWKALPIIPPLRKLEMERSVRQGERLMVNTALLSRAVSYLGGALVDPTAFTSILTSMGKKSAKKPRVDAVKRKLRTTVISWQDAQHLASLALGHALTDRGEVTTTQVEITFENILTAWRSDKTAHRNLGHRIEKHLPPVIADEKNHSGRKADERPGPPPPDPVIERIKRSKDLNPYERRLLSCIVDSTKLTTTTFDEVHLPFKTKDAIRTIISLPLLYPEAFQGGVLRHHATTGALLFGPPGTGKTLLARAVANESGARMLSIQPSDVNDKYVGEGEKLVKAVFSLARRLSPCVVFLDEVDALFGARSGRGASSGSRALDQLLTEFMQELDGLNSAGTNKEKRIVVIGATNRPFDLDDAVLRRLPRRLLVDLPGLEDRKAILVILLRDEKLDQDVDLDQLAKETDGFSGSDLKQDLCVSAALSAIKDVVNVPWIKQAPDSPQGHEISSSFPATGSLPRAGMTVENLPQPQELEDGKEPQPIQARRDVSHLPLSHVEPVFGVVQLSRDSGDEEKHLVGTVTSTANTTSSANSTPPQEGVSGPESARADIEGEEEDDADTDTDTDAEAPTPMIQSRLVARKHFVLALAEIRPSSTEEGSLPELRKWAEQFGEGGKARGKRKGFGKGFGFNDPANAEKDPGYGRVAGQ